MSSDEGEANRHFWNLIASYDPARMARSMSIPGSQWSDADYTNAQLRCLALADHDPDDGTNEGAELAAIYAKKEEFEDRHFENGDGGIRE